MLTERKNIIRTILFSHVPLFRTNSIDGDSPNWIPAKGRLTFL